MTRITLAHGNGGQHMRELIEELFAATLQSPLLDTNADAVSLPALPGEMMMTTDGYTVQPLEFPGGNIGSLAVHGTVNDLAVSGATPRYLSVAMIIEEGLDLPVLQRVITAMAKAANECEVQIVCGDTKVVPRGETSGLFITTTGIGYRDPGLKPGMRSIRPGDSILVSGPVGDHGTAVMLARQQFGLQGDLRSDAGSVRALCEALHDLPGLRFMRDPTRGGLATVLHEIHRASGLGLRIDAPRIPVRDTVRTVCEMLGYDPLYLACEGRVVAVLDANEAEIALARWRNLPSGAQAAIIGKVETTGKSVMLVTELGGERLLEELQDDPLPRIC